jgi:SPX domain protein involved in polyphosphate accumulation
MGYQSVFQRYELKYLLTRQQQETVLREMKDYMALDQYGKTVIRNVYYDTDNYLLIRRSIEKPAYKEKLRLRSYCQATPGTPVFVELKKKYDSVVYKRRLSVEEQQAMQWLRGAESFSPGSREMTQVFPI